MQKGRKGEREKGRRGELLGVGIPSKKHFPFSIYHFPFWRNQAEG
jgi:hypothetical protein